MIARYSALVRSYVLGGQEEDLAAISTLGVALLTADVPIEELAGMHERALLDLDHQGAAVGARDTIRRTSACLTELMIAYSMADQKRKELLAHEQRVERDRQRLETLGHMAGGIAHEFNNLLQPIIGMAELALEDTDDAELRDRLSTIMDCARQAATVARGILTTARQQTAAARPVALGPLVRRTADFLRAVLPFDQRIELSVTCGAEQALCEEGEFSQVLVNLVRNGMDAMGGTGTVRIALDRETAEADAGGAPRLRLSIADKGAGMSPEVAARAFEPFFTTKGPTQGTGLGLSIVMAIVLSWGAGLETETAPGQGTRMSILFPVLTGHEPAEP